MSSIWFTKTNLIVLESINLGKKRLVFSVSLRNLESYLDSLSVLADSTLKQKKTVLVQFADFCKSKYKESESEIISELMKQNQDERILNACDLLQMFINSLTKTVKPVTIPSYLGHVTGYFNYRGIKISSLDKKSIRFPKKIYEEKYPLSKEEIKLILDNSNYKRKMLYLILLSSGMRIGETVALTKHDFDVEGKRIMIKIPARITKTKRARTTFVSKEAQQYLMKRLNQIQDNDLVFGVNANQTKSKEQEARRFSFLIDKIFPHMEKYDSGTRKITLHSFRAFFITQAVRTVSDSFAHTIAGQEGYLKMYKRYDKEAMLEDYLKVEPRLFILNDYGLGEISKDNEIEDLKSQMKTNSNDMQDLKKLVSALAERLNKKSN